jgi:hypothetical protein
MVDIYIIVFRARILNTWKGRRVLFTVLRS